MLCLHPAARGLSDRDRLATKGLIIERHGVPSCPSSETSQPQLPMTAVGCCWLSCSNHLLYWRTDDGTGGGPSMVLKLLDRFYNDTFIILSSLSHNRESVSRNSNSLPRDAPEASKSSRGPRGRYTRSTQKTINVHPCVARHPA